MVRTQLVPTLMSLRLLGPRLLVAKFRGQQRNLTVIVAHTPTGDADDEDRAAFYLLLTQATQATNEMDTKIVLIDANAGPGNSRDGWEHIVGPHGVPYPYPQGQTQEAYSPCVWFGQYQI